MEKCLILNGNERANKTQFPIKGFSLGLALKQRYNEQGNYVF